MILDMIVWGFFSALGWMGANYAVEKIKGEPTELRCDQSTTGRVEAEVPAALRGGSKTQCKGS